MTLEELRGMNPGHWVLPTDEEVNGIVEEKARAEEAARIAAEEHAAAEAAKAERIAALEAELASLKGEEVAQG